MGDIERGSLESGCAYKVLMGGWVVRGWGVGRGQGGGVRAAEQQQGDGAEGEGENPFG